MSNSVITSAILAVLAAISMPVSATMNTASQTPMQAIKGMEKCYGIAKAGQNDCGTANHMCAGESAMAGDKEAWISVPTGLCNRIVNGSTKPAGNNT